MKLFRPIILFPFLIIIAGCLMPTESNFKIKIVGSHNIKFSGSYMIVTADGQSSSHTVDGIVPAEYEVKGWIISCAFQKQSEQGSLSVLVYRNGQLIAQSTTSAAYGVVTLATRGDATPSAPAAQKATEPARAAALTPEQQAEEQKRRAQEAEAKREQEALALGLRWQYYEFSEKMGRGTVKHATVGSLNEVQFGFPYSGAQRGTLHLRIHPKYGKDVMLSIEKGQFLCGIYHCQVAVRFDNGKAQNFTAVEPADHSTTMLFIRGYDRFLAGARKAKKVYIEAQFYQQGKQVFEFDISGLKW